MFATMRALTGSQKFPRVRLDFAYHVIIVSFFVRAGMEKSSHYMKIVRRENTGSR